MSEPKLISPMLDGFLMGTPMSDHDGVICCPAMKENSDHKYIVKVISVPASQRQLDALLLAGAYRDPAAAMDYFKEQSDGIVAEAQCLQELSKLDGFLSYEACQVVPMDHSELGYQVYLLGSYRRSLEKHMRTTMLTHLEAVNLGLDMCSALATVRRAGYLYVDLKPTNIFLTEQKGFRIGDLGFLALADLNFTALPEKYISPYSPRELSDPMANVNLTADTYSLGMVLYQVFNDGQLPKVPEDPQEGFPTPVNADYELAEIILKALSPDPDQRYQDPQEMGQALAQYLQRNNVNETPVTPQSTVISDPRDIVPPDEPMMAYVEELEKVPTLEESEKEDVPADETMPTAEDAPTPEEHIPISKEVSEMVEKADELIIHETPKGVEVPEPKKDPFENFDPDAKIDWTKDDSYIPDPLYELKKVEIPETPKKETPKKPVHWGILGAVAGVIAAMLFVGGFFYYRNVFLQTIDDLFITGTLNSLTVTVHSDVKPALLTVVCEDAYGNDIRQPLKESGETTFENLQTDSLYRVSLEIEGFHKLRGKTKAEFTTEARTSITSFQAVAGSENGSVELNFTIDGPEPSEWILTYGTETEETKRQVFYGHSVTIKNLSVGKTYHFELTAGDDTTIIGDGNKLDFTAVNILLAEDVRVTTDGPDTLAVHWQAPEGSDIKSWNVRCYDGEGYDQNVDVVSREAHFTNINFNQSYIVEVLAEGMTQSVRATITDNPITVKNFQTDTSDPEHLRFTWEYEGNRPEDGWLVSYRLDQGRTTVIPCKEDNLSLSLIVPDATYNFSIQSATGVSTFEGIHSYTTPKPQPYQGFGLDASTLETHMLRTGTRKDNVTPENFRTSFRVGNSLSLFMHTNENFKIPEEEVELQYVFRDENGSVLPRQVATETVSWNTIWEGANYHDGMLDLPVTPRDPGKYSITIYADGMLLAEAHFTLTK